MTLDRVWLLDRFYNPNREALGVERSCTERTRMQNSSPPERAPCRRHGHIVAARRDAHQKPVSDGVTRCVVHFLEAIEIDVQQGQRAALLVDFARSPSSRFWNCNRLGKLVNMSKWAMCSISCAACAVRSRPRSP